MSSPRVRCIAPFVAPVTVVGLASVLALLFVAGWLVGAYALAPAPPCIAAPTPLAACKKLAAAPPAPRPEPVRFVESPSLEAPPLRPAPLWESPAWSAPPRPPSFRPATPGSYDFLIREAALRHSLSPDLVKAVAQVESNFNPYAVSKKGALGLLQVMPDTARRFGVRPERLFDPEQNLAAGAAYLSWLFERYDGDLDLALAAYNAGEGAVDKHGGIPPYRETQDYVRRVRVALAYDLGIRRSLPELRVMRQTDR